LIFDKIGTPMFPAKKTLYHAFLSVTSKILTVVVFPFVAVTQITFPS
jgi:hypothetical protein